MRKTIFLLVSGLALLVVALAACTSSPPPAQTDPVSPVAEAPQEVQRVTLEESKQAFDNDAATFVDVRSDTAYAASHIPGALSIPLAELEARITELDPERWIITYCT